MLHDVPEDYSISFDEINNKFGSMVSNSVEKLTKLKILDLGANRLRNMEGIENLISLESLWLGKNKIEVISNLNNLVHLKQIDIQSNRLIHFYGGDFNNVNFIQLKELYFANNRINSTDGLPESIIHTLKTLDLSYNKVSLLRNL